MTRRFPARALALALAITSTIACGSGGDAPTRATLTGPTAASQPPGSPVRLTVTNGWTNARVPLARVTVGAETTVTDASGQFEVNASVDCLPATFTAAGFLERRVKCLAAAYRREPVTLWPVEDDTERDALRAFAFRGYTLVRRTSLQVDFAREVQDRAAAVAVWQRADRQLRDATAGLLSATLPINVEGLQDGTIVAPWSAPTDCTEISSAAWFAVLGFCRGTYRGDAYPAFISLMRVAPLEIVNEAVALRTLLYEFGLRPHPLPGVLSATRTESALSDFERRTLHMLTLRDRGWPFGVSWPDTEF